MEPATSVKARDPSIVGKDKPQTRDPSGSVKVKKPARTFKNVSDVHRVKDELLKAGSLYQDEEFPPSDSTDIVWVRPTDLSLNPTLTVDPILLDLHSQADDAGAFVGAFATIALYKELVARLCPESQSFSKNYCGLFYFKFWQFGEWMIVVVDDRLPYISSKKKLLRLRSKREDEFFFSLLEKAYAKFVGGYKALASTKAGDILVDLTGGVSEMWTLTKKNSSDWFPMLEKLADAQLPATANFQKTDFLCGFDSRITYVLRDVVSIDLPQDHKTVRLVKLVDPWGKLARYNGDWNNDAPEWRQVPQHLREKLAPKNDGSVGAIYEFWMTFYDFMSIFTHVQFCLMSPSDMGPLVQGVRWELTTIKGQFPRYIPAVSKIDNKASTIHEIYPQYLVELTDLDDYKKDGKCELVVSLLQKTTLPGTIPMMMGFSFFSLTRSKDRPPLKQGFFNDSIEAARSPVSSSREIVSRLRLLPGYYVMVLLTTSEFKEREFLVRIYKHQRYNVFGHVISYLSELTPSKKGVAPSRTVQEERRKSLFPEIRK